VHTMRAIAAAPAALRPDAAQLVSGYVALTQTKRGRPEPAHTADLPTVLRIECEDVADVPPFFRRVLVAFDGDEPPGCVGCDRARIGTARVKRLLVRPGRSATPS